MQIDLSTFRSAACRSHARRVWASGGTLLGQIDKETALHEMVTPLGTVSHTGVGGLTLGGGFGRVARKFGMAIDNVESVDVVTADGKLVHASASENPELYWGARGGSGNFGVVTQFEFKLHPMKREVIAGSVVFPLAKAREMLTLWSEYAPAAPDELYFDPTVMQPPGNGPGMAALQVATAGHRRMRRRRSRRFASWARRSRTRSRPWSTSRCSAPATPPIRVPLRRT